MYGEVVSAVPMSVQVPAFAGERWNRTLATAESVSAAAPVRMTVPARGEPGSVRAPLGATLSTLKETWWPTTRPEVLALEVLLPVAPAPACVMSSEPMLTAPVVPIS